MPFVHLISRSALAECALCSWQHNVGSNHAIQASAGGWQRRILRRRARAHSLDKLRRRESSDQGVWPDPDQNPEIPDGPIPNKMDRNDDRSELFSDPRRQNSRIDTRTTENSPTLVSHLPPDFDIALGCTEFDSKHGVSQETTLPHHEEASCSSPVSNRVRKHRRAPWRSIKISVTGNGATVEVSITDAPDSPQSAADSVSAAAAAALKLLQSTESQPRKVDSGDVICPEPTTGSGNNIVTTRRDNSRTVKSSTRASSSGKSSGERIQSIFGNSHLKQTQAQYSSSSSSSSGDVLGSEQVGAGVSDVPQEAVLKAALNYGVLERLCLAAATLELWESLPGVVMLIAMQPEAQSELRISSGFVQGLERRDDGYELGNVLNSDELDAFGAGTLHYKGGNGEILQHRAHHGLLFKTLPGTRPRPLRLALIQSMTPDNFDLASLSRRHLDVLELDRLVVGADQSPLLNGMTEIVHSSIIVVDPLVPSRILHHQAHPLSVRDIELLHIKLRLQSLGARPALACHDILADSLLGIARDQEGLKILPLAQSGEHWHWSALEALSRSDQM